MKIKGRFLRVGTLVFTCVAAHLALVGSAQVALPWARAFCFEANVTDLSGQKYFPAVKEAIASAQKSIVVVMFTVESTAVKGSKPDELVSLLIDAHKRGVAVKVILDLNVDFVNLSRSWDWEPRMKSTKAFQRLKEAGVDVSYDEPARYAHAKAVIIDERIAIVGSTNWTRNAFDNSIEMNVMVESPALCAQLLHYVTSIKLDKTAEEMLSLGKGLAVSRVFLQDSRFGPKLAREHLERGFDLYLYLVWKFTGDEQGRVFLAYEEAARYLGIYEGWTPEAYRRQISKALRSLEKLKLISFEPRYAREASVVLLDYADGRKPYAVGAEKTFRVAEEYFTLGWNRRMSLRAKFCWLVNLAYTQDSDIRPFWSKSVATISRECGGVSKYIINPGMGELRRLNLLEVRYDELGGKPYDQRRPKRYKLLPLYDPRERETALAGLEAAYGKSAYGTAVAYARIVCEENNPEVIEDILLKTRQYGEKEIRRVFSEVARKNIDNPKRTYEYVINIIQDVLDNP